MCRYMPAIGSFALLIFDFLMRRFAAFVFLIFLFSPAEAQQPFALRVIPADKDTVFLNQLFRQGHL